eukprot:12595308-Alexandrium_andersonii.AAC.1
MTPCRPSQGRLPLQASCSASGARGRRRGQEPRCPGVKAATWATPGVADSPGREAGSTGNSLTASCGYLPIW